MAILRELLLAFMVPESAPVSPASTWLGHASAAEAKVGHSGPLNGDVFLHPCPALRCAAQRPHVSAESRLERSLHSPRDKREERDEKLV